MDLLKNKFGFDDAFNYKEEHDLNAALQRSVSISCHLMWCLLRFFFCLNYHGHCFFLRKIILEPGQRHLESNSTIKKKKEKEIKKE